MSKELIIVAEDSAPNRNILVHLLTKLGFEVQAFEDGKQAWDYLNNDKPESVAVIISDIMMPNMDGMDLLKKIREESHIKEVPFIFVTAVSDRENIMQAKSLHVNGYILKPVTFQRVTQKLQQLFPEKVFKTAS
jgi:two-component system chemotaxis response regulator CheY